MGEVKGAGIEDRDEGDEEPLWRFILPEEQEHADDDEGEGEGEEVEVLEVASGFDVVVVVVDGMDF